MNLYIIFHRRLKKIKIMKLLYVSAMIVLFTLEPNALGQSIENYCNDGWEICASTGSCIPSVCKGDFSSSQSCGPGQTYSSICNGCIPACPMTTSASYQNQAQLCVGELAFCISTATCIPEAECDDFNSMKSSICPNDLIFCSWSGKCLKNLCGPSPRKHSCTLGTVFCIDTQSCESRCKSLAAAVDDHFKESSFLLPLVCGPGEVWCSNSNNCESAYSCALSNVFPSNYKRSHRCRYGMIFCVKTGKCELRDSCEANLPSIDSSSRICVGDTVYCVQSKRCVPPETCKSESIAQLFKENPPKQCLPGMIFCVETGMCTTPENCDWKPPLQFKPSPTTHLCKNGKVFCVATGKCAYEGFCSLDDEHFQTDSSGCHGKEVFCVSLGKCVSEGLCLDLDQEGLQDFKFQSTLICPIGKVFCLSSQTCELEGACTSRSEDDFGNMCPKNYVYCMDEKKCVLATQGCSNDGSYRRCPVGTVLCADDGRCSKKCESEAIMGSLEHVCPINRGVFSSTTCMFDTDCSYDYLCCPDIVTKHRQCVNSAGEIDESALATSCLNMLSVPTDYMTTDTGIECSVPTDCSMGSICCNDACRTPRGKYSCAPLHMYCNYTNSCIKVGDQCGILCRPGYIMCVTPTGTIIENECSIPHPNKGGSPWMLKLIICTGDDCLPVEDQKITDQWTESTADASLKVLKVVSEFGEFQWKKFKNDAWRPITVDTIFWTYDFLRFQPDNDVYVFGIAYLHIIETGSQIERDIVQVLNPAPPEFKCEQKVEKFTTLEDEANMFRIGEVMTCQSKDIQYWSTMSDSMGLLSMYAHMGLLDSTHASVKEWLEKQSLLNFGANEELENCDGPTESNVFGEMRNLPTSEIRRGIKVQFKERCSLDEEINLFIIEASINRGKSWKILSCKDQKLELFVSSSKALENVFIRVIPGKDISGDMKLLFTSIILETRDGKTVNDALNEYFTPVELNIQILPINDAPEPFLDGYFAKLPKLTDASPKIQLNAGELASLFFKDSDGDTMGVAVLYAQISNFGEWSYSSDLGISWHPILDLGNKTQSSTFTMNGNYQGIIMGGDLYDRSVLSYLSSPQENISPEDESPTFGLTVEESIPTIVENKNNEVLIRYFRPSDIIRFTPSSNAKQYTIVDAIENTKFHFRAWDLSEETDEDKVDRNVRIMNKECGSFNSISCESAVICAEWTDCNGDKVIDVTSPKIIDKCGVCGGDGKSCVDCADVINGTAFIECSRCVEGNTGITLDEERDCAGQCRMNEIVTVNGNAICVLESEQFIPCDGIDGSSAIVNICGFCVGGNTNIPLDYLSVDTCGHCNGSNECVGCDGIPFSGKIFDLCGNCHHKDDDEYNNCQKLGKPTPTVFDVGEFMSLDVPTTLSITDDISHYKWTKKLRPIVMKVKAVGMSSDDYDIDLCYLTDTSGLTIQCLAENFSGPKLIIILQTNGLKAGIYNLTCEFVPISDNGIAARDSQIEKVTLTSKDKIFIVNSMDISFEKLGDNIISQEDKQINVILDKETYVGDAVCVLSYNTETEGGMKRFSVLKNSQTADLTLLTNTISFRIETPLSPGLANMTILLTKSLMTRLKSEDNNIFKMPVNIMAAVPEVKHIMLSSTNNFLIITFNRNIYSAKDCTTNFINNIIFGQGSVCKLVSSQMKIALGKGHQIENGTTLTFTNPSTIIQKYADSSSAVSASGEIIVNQKNKVEKELLLKVTNSACNTSSIRALADFRSVIEPNKYKIAWNVTCIVKNESSSSDTIMLAWKSLANIQNAINESMLTESNDEDGIKTIQFSGNLLMYGVRYELEAKLMDGPQAADINVARRSFETIPQGKNLVVVIDGFTKISADRTYIYTLKFRSCDSDVNVDQLKYNFYWKLDGDARPLQAGDKATTIIIPPFTLKGGKSYNIKVLIQSYDMLSSGLGSLRINVERRGVKVILSQNRLKIGQDSDINIDAAQTYDLDGNDLALKFRWKCETLEGTACFITVDGAIRRWENTVSREMLSSKNINIMKNTLPVNTYRFICSVIKGNETYTNEATVTIASGNLPELFTKSPATDLDVTKAIKIYGACTCRPGCNIHWSSVGENGSSTVDLDLFTEMKTFEDESIKRQFWLLLPEPSLAWEGLKSGSTYKFRLSAFVNGGKSSHADIVVKTKDPPFGCKLRVSPNEGVALITKFEFKAVECRDPDLPLSVNFGYKLKGSNENVIWSKRVYGDNLTSTLIITANENNAQVIPIAKISDSSGAYTEVNHTAIKIDLPTGDSLSNEILAASMTNFVNDLRVDSQIFDVLRKYVFGMEVVIKINATKQVKMMVELYEDEVFKKAGDLQRRMHIDNATYDAINSLLKGMQMNFKKGPFTLYSLRTAVDLKRSLLLEWSPTQRMAQGTESVTSRKASSQELIFQEKKDIDRARKTPLISDFETSSMHSDLHYITLQSEEESTVDTLQVTRIKRSYQSGRDYYSDMMYKRFKRETNEQLPNYRPINNETVKTYILLDETEIRNAQTQGSKNIAMDEFMNNIHGYLSALCLSMKPGSPPIQINGKLVVLRVVRSQLMPEEDDIRPIIEHDETTETFIEETSTVRYGTMLDQFKHRIIELDNGEKEHRYGACICHAEFNGLFAAPKTRASIPSNMQHSHMILTSVIDPITGHVLNPEPGPPITLSMAVKRQSQEGLISKCFGWQSEEWSSTACKNVVRRSSSVSWVSCNCDKPGFVKVFGIQSNNIETTVSTTAAPNQPTISIIKRMKLTVKLNGDYNESVLGREEEFKEYIAIQFVYIINDQLDTYYTLANIIILDVSPGSIMLDVEIIENEGQRISGSTRSIDDVHEFLLQQILSGNLVFEGLGQEHLPAVPTSQAVADQAYIPLLIGGIVGGVLLIGVVMVILAIYINKKKRMDKVSPISGTLQPTYRAILFEKDLNGTADSITKNKHSDVTNWKPDSETYKGDGLFIERRSSSNKSSRSDLKFGTAPDDDQVPNAFAYKKPSKLELERSGPIPEHINYPPSHADKSRPSSY